MSTDLLVLFGIWCGLAFAFGLGWIMGAAAAMSKHADDMIERWSR